MTKPRYTASFDDGAHIRDDASITHDLFMDSIQILELIVDIEEHFGISFDFDNLEASKIQTIGSIIDLIQEQLSQEAKR
jgi:acyl carrier protein